MITQSKQKKLTSSNLQEKIEHYKSEYSKGMDDDSKVKELKEIALFANTDSRRDKLKGDFLYPFRVHFHHFLTQNNHVSAEFLDFIKNKTSSHTRICIFKESEKLWATYLKYDKSFTLPKSIIEKTSDYLLLTIPVHILNEALQKHTSKERTRKKLKSKIREKSAQVTTSENNALHEPSINSILDSSIKNNETNMTSRYIFFPNAKQAEYETIEATTFQTNFLDQDAINKRNSTLVEARSLLSKPLNLKTDKYYRPTFTATDSNHLKRKHEESSQEEKTRKLRKVSSNNDLTSKDNNPFQLMYDLLQTSEQDESYDCNVKFPFQANDKQSDSLVHFIDDDENIQLNLKKIKSAFNK